MLTARKFYILLLVTTSLLVGCSINENSKQLNAIENLLTYYQIKPAEKNLHNLVYAKMHEREQALYDLLSFQIAWKLNQPIKSSTELDKCIAYFERHNDLFHLARAYYYKGSLLCENGEVKQGITLYKKSEKIVRDDDLSTKHHIQEGLSNYNLQYNSLGLALKYATSALHLARILKKPDLQGYDHYLLVLCYNGMGNLKEAEFHTQQLLNILPQMTEKGQMDVLGVLGEFYQQRNPKRLESLMTKAFQQKENVIPYLYLAALRYNQGKKATAYSLLNKAEKMKYGKNNYTLLEVKRDMKMQDGDFVSANRLSMQMILLKDSILQAESNKDLQAIQCSFDQRIESEKHLRMLSYLIMAIIFFILSISMLTFYVKFRMQKMKVALNNDCLEIIRLNECIKKSKQAQADTEMQREQQENEIIKLTNKISQIEKKHNGLLSEGRKCYIDILNGQSTISWKKQNFKAFVEYYKIIETNFLYDLEKEYHNLTDKNKFIFILIHLGLSQNVIAERLGVGEGAIRTALSRVHKKRKKI